MKPVLIRDLMTTDVIVAGPSTPLSEILTQMTERKIHQIPIIGEGDRYHQPGEIIGMAVVNKIVTREFFPHRTKARAVSIPTATLSPTDSIERAAALIVNANLRAIPVCEDGQLVGIISEQDLMKVIELKGSAKEIARTALCVDSNVGIGKVKDMMVHANISRVPVLSAGKPIGVVGTLDMIKILQPGQTRREARAIGGARDRGWMEAQHEDSVSVKNVMHNAPIVKEKESLRKVIELLRDNEEVLVQNSKLEIITPKDVLRKWLGVRIVGLIQISGLDRDEDVETVSAIQQKAIELMQHLAPSMELQSLKIYIKKHRKQGPKVKYSVKAELPTSLGTFVSTRSHGRADKSYDNLQTAVQRALDDLESQIRAKQEELAKPDRAAISTLRTIKEEGIGLRGKKLKRKRI